MSVEICGELATDSVLIERGIMLGMAEQVARFGCLGCCEERSDSDDNEALASVDATDSIRSCNGSCESLASTLGRMAREMRHAVIAADAREVFESF